jgi:hypothetical protein
VDPRGPLEKCVVLVHDGLNLVIFRCLKRSN